MGEPDAEAIRPNSDDGDPYPRSLWVGMSCLDQGFSDESDQILNCSHWGWASGADVCYKDNEDSIYRRRSFQYYRNIGSSENTFPSEFCGALVLKDDGRWSIEAVDCNKKRPFCCDNHPGVFGIDDDDHNHQCLKHFRNREHVGGKVIGLPTPASRT